MNHQAEGFQYLKTRLFCAVVVIPTKNLFFLLQKRSNKLKLFYGIVGVTMGQINLFE